MLVWITWIVFIAILWVFAFYRTSPRFWIPAIFIILLNYSLLHLMSYFSLILCWVIWILVSGFVLISPLRQKYFTSFFLKWFRKRQPTLTTAEQQVLDAGGLWWEQQFFTGKPDWQALEKISLSRLTVMEQAFIDNQVNTLCEMLNDWKIINEYKDLPKKIWDYLKKEKFWGLIIEQQYGGHGFSALAHSTIVSKIASRSYTAAITVMVPNSLGPAEFLNHYGTPEQKKYYLPRLAQGKEIPCFGLTAPNAGSDAASLTDNGVVCQGEYEGQQIIGICLNWEKRYITLAPIATLIGLAFHLYDPEHLLSDEEDIGMTLALIPAHLPGIEKGKRHNPLHQAFMNGPIRGKNVFIPLNMIIGGVEQRGQGWTMIMECLAVGRGISLPALSTGISKLCSRMTSAYALIREQFHRPIGEFDGVKEALARIGGFTYLCEATRLFTAQAVESGARPAVASAIAKYHLTELSRHVLADAMDIHAGRSIQLGPRNYLGNFHEALPINITVEGANILTRNLIIFGQGAMRCHPYIRAEIAAADSNDPMKFKQFDHLILTHIGFLISQVARSVIYGITGGRWIRIYKADPTAKLYRQLTRMSNALILVTDITLVVMGGQLKIKEALSARLGDVLSHLYMASAVLKYFHEGGSHNKEYIFVDWCVHYCLYQIQQAFFEFFSNFPKNWIAKLMKWVIFPWGRVYVYPHDVLAFQIADLLQQDSVLRERITRYCYVGDSIDDPSGRIELVMKQLLGANDILQKLATAVKEKKIKRENSLAAFAENAYNRRLLSEIEFKQLCELDALIRDAITVDEF